MKNTELFLNTFLINDLICSQIQNHKTKKAVTCYRTGHNLTVESHYAVVNRFCFGIS